MRPAHIDTIRSRGFGRTTVGPLLAFLLTTLGLTACRDAPAPDASQTDELAAAAAAMSLEDPATCQPCHEAVVAEWRESMHARAHHDSDPIYAGVRKLRMAKEGDAVAMACAGCHTPRDPTQKDPTIAATGVACAACHTTQSLTPGKHGAAALVSAAAGQIMGPNAPTNAPAAPHATAQWPEELRDGATLCGACHDKLIGPKGVPMCTTGPEHQSPGGGNVAGQTCTSCHMPEVQGPSGVLSQRKTHRSHHFAGPHRAWYQDDPELLAGAVELAGTLTGGKLAVQVKNVSGHAMPTGFPGRMAFVRATASDAAGKELWRNITKAPMADDPAAVLNKVYVNAEGKPTLAPWATALKRDTRLKAGETRALSWEVPEGTASAKVELVVRLLPGKLARKMGLPADAVENTPRSVKTVTIAATP